MIELPDDVQPASAGLFGCLGQDMIRLVERLPNVKPHTVRLPKAALLRHSAVTVMDSVNSGVKTVAPAWVSSALSAEAAYTPVAERVTAAVRKAEEYVSGGGLMRQELVV